MSGRIRSVRGAAEMTFDRWQRPVPFTVPSMPLSSTVTSPAVSRCPGRMNTASLKASPYRSFRPATVKKDRLSGWVTGMSRRGPKTHTLIATPIATTTRVRSPTVEKCNRLGAASSGTPPPTAGSSHPTIQLFSTIPPMAEAIPNKIKGTVMTDGDSCGCTSCCQRLAPKNVINMSRVI